LPETLGRPVKNVRAFLHREAREVLKGLGKGARDLLAHRLQLVGDPDASPRILGIAIEVTPPFRHVGQAALGNVQAGGMSAGALLHTRTANPLFVQARLTSATSA
jgi:hypothetical protein